MNTRTVPDPVFVLAGRLRNTVAEHLDTTISHHAALDATTMILDDIKQMSIQGAASTSLEDVEQMIAVHITASTARIDGWSPFTPEDAHGVSTVILDDIAQLF